MDIFMTENKAMSACIVIAMLGARRHYAVPRILHQAGLLDRFFTDSYSGNKLKLNAVFRAIPQAIQPQAVKRWLDRMDTILPREKITSFENIGLWYALARRRMISRQYTAREIAREAAKRFNRRIIKVGFGSAKIVWGFNGASLELFVAAKQQGRLCVLEQTSAPRKIELQLLYEEHQRWRDWTSNYPNLVLPASWEERYEEEWRLADRILVGSDFVYTGLVKCGIVAEKIRIVPYGMDLERFGCPERMPDQPNRVLRVLFVGSVSVMKGVPDLLQALARLGPRQVEARLVGGISLNQNRLKSFSSVAQFTGHIPRSAMSQHYQWADVFCFPSITEGSAAVTYEALASGLPVITTPNAGSIVRDGVDGFIVPIRDPNALAEAIARYAEDRALLAQHQAATEESRQFAGLDRYRSDLVRVVREVLQC